MNILYIAHDLNINGATLSLIGLIDELKNYKDIGKVYVVVKNKNGDLIHELEKRKIKVIKAFFFDWLIEVEGKNKFILYSRYILRNFINIISSAIISLKIRKLDIDIIHTNSSVVNIGGFIKKITGKPHIWHIREFGKEDHNLEFPLFKNKCIKFMNNNSDRIIVISKSVYEKYSKLLDSKKIYTIYNGVSRSYINKKDYFNIKKANILMAGSIKKNKGQEEAIEAVKNLIFEGLDVNLLIIGSGNDLYINKLKDIIKQYKIEDKIIIKSFSNNLNKIRKQSNLELVCSKKEAFGRVTVEAMLSMNAVIGANTGGTKELIKDGENGVLYEQGNIEDLTEKLRSIVTDLRKAKKLGERGFVFANENFISSINAENIYKQYKDIIVNK